MNETMKTDNGFGANFNDSVKTNPIETHNNDNKNNCNCNYSKVWKLQPHAAGQHQYHFYSLLLLLLAFILFGIIRLAAVRFNNITTILILIVS